MKQLLSLILLCMSYLNSVSQTNDGDHVSILGKWTMIKMEVKDGFYFDISDKDSSYKRFFKVITESSPYYSKNGAPRQLSEEDSTSIKDAFEKSFTEFKQIFVEFQKDNKLISNQSGSEGVSKVVSGTFSLNTKDHILSRMENGIKGEDVYYEIHDKQLIIRRMGAENASSIIVFSKEG